MHATLDKVIARSTIVDLVAAHLYATSVIDDDTEITNVQFGDLFGVSDVELVPIKIHTSKEVSTKQ